MTKCTIASCLRNSKWTDQQVHATCWTVPSITDRPAGVCDMLNCPIYHRKTCRCLRHFYLSHQSQIDLQVSVTCWPVPSITERPAGVCDMLTCPIYQNYLLMNVTCWPVQSIIYWPAGECGMLTCLIYHRLTCRWRWNFDLPDLSQSDL